MAVRHPFGETITVTRAGGPNGETDGVGNPVILAPSTFTVDDVALAPEGSDETTEAPGVWTVTGYKVFCPYGTVLLPTDRLTIRGVAGWQVEGDTTASGWRSPFDGVGRGVVLMARRAG